MGLGDNLMATGMAKGAAARGKRIAFGNGSNIIWDHNSEQIFRGNPNIASPGSEHDCDIEWIPFYKGNRIYNKHDHINERWIWNYQFKAQPGEMFFSDEELSFVMKATRNFNEKFVIIEPNVPSYKGCAPNKTWPLYNYTHIAQLLKQKGFDVRQFSHHGDSIPGVNKIKTPSFRHALAVLSKAALYIGPEGGLHHGAAAVGIPAVVIFGGFIPPQVTGYDSHINLTGESKQACGSLTTCPHCAEAMKTIKIKHVYSAAKDLLKCSISSLGSGETNGQRSMQNDCLQESSAI